MRCCYQFRSERIMNWILLSFELLALLSCGKAQNAVSVVSPAGLATQDGNTNTWYPFFPNSIRYQQVYSASEFSVLTNFGGGWILGILFRGDRYAWAVTFPSVQFNFSTTARGPDNLSSVFAENVGADDAVVFKGSLYAGAFAGMPS